MEKFQLDKHMVESIEYMRNELKEGRTIYGVLDMILQQYNTTKEFNNYSLRIYKYFNEFCNDKHQEYFIKCLLGHYQIIKDAEDLIFEYYQDSIRGSVDSKESISSYSRGEKCAVEFVLEKLDRLDIIMKPE